MSVTYSPDTTLIESFDGTTIAVHRWEGTGGTPMLVVNAIGPDLSAWRPVIADARREREVVSWDLRGLHGSGPPISERLDAAAHSEDAMAVLESAGIEEFVIAAWSTGTHVAVEIARNHPERVRGMVLACGGFGTGLLGLLRHLEIAPLFPLGAAIGKHFASSLEGPLRAFVARPEIAGVVRQSGVIGPAADVNSIVALVQSFAACDLRTLLTIYERVVGDRDPRVLSEVQAPTLLIGGNRDRFATRRMREEMLRRLPSGEIVVYEKASHFLPLEYPNRLAADIEGWFSDL
jgi:pimeloyl-ACP methyl ester carboxylesterase